MKRKLLFATFIMFTYFSVAAVFAFVFTKLPAGSFHHSYAYLDIEITERAKEMFYNRKFCTLIADKFLVKSKIVNEKWIKHSIGCTIFLDPERTFILYNRKVKTEKPDKPGRVSVIQMKKIKLGHIKDRIYLSFIKIDQRGLHFNILANSSFKEDEKSTFCIFDKLIYAPNGDSSFEIIAKEGSLLKKVFEEDIFSFFKANPIYHKKEKKSMNIKEINNLISYINGVPNKEVSFSRMLYFSIVTITTLGYGDILPLSSLARNLISAEMMIGFILLAYLGVVISTKD